MIIHMKSKKVINWTFNSDFMWTERLSGIFIFLLNFPKSFIMNIQSIFMAEGF